jgi:hypothetical protein
MFEKLSAGGAGAAWFARAKSVTATCSGFTTWRRSSEATTEGGTEDDSSSNGRAGGETGCGTFFDGDILSFPLRRGDTLLSANRGERGSRRIGVDAPLEDSCRIPRVDVGMVDVGMVLVGKEASGVVLASPTPLSTSAAQLHFS